MALAPQDGEVAATGQFPQTHVGIKMILEERVDAAEEIAYGNGGIAQVALDGLYVAVPQLFLCRAKRQSRAFLFICSFFLFNILFGLFCQCRMPFLDVLIDIVARFYLTLGAFADALDKTVIE